MSINSHIQDSKYGLKASVIQKDGIKGLHVITQDYKEYKNKSVFFFNDIYGSNMNQDFATDTVASTENVHNGEDNTYWTATTISGNTQDFDFSSTDIAHTGAQSIDCTASEGGDQFQLENDTLINPYKYNRLVGWIYVTGLWGLTDDGLEIILYNTVTGITVSSNPVDLDDYIDGTNTDTWQRFSISMEDFGIITNDYNALRCTVLEGGDPPNFYLDDIQLEELATEEAIFSIEPPRGKWWHITGLGFGLAAPYDSTLADASMPNIPYTGLLGVTLTNGITYQRQENGEVAFSFIMTDLIDILNQHNAIITSQGYDGNNTWIKVDVTFRYPFVLKSEYSDYISFNASDNLSGLNYFRAVADIREEARDANGYDPNGVIKRNVKI